MKLKRRTYVRGLVVGFVSGTAMLSGTAFAGFAAPEIDPGLAVGGLTILGVGLLLLIEIHRAQQ
jgi:hypothetical protein